VRSHVAVRPYNAIAFYAKEGQDEKNNARIPCLSR
jgi:hypothetical protein